jgi:hypothetical protein
LQLGDNNYITYLFEDDDTTADKFLDAAKKSFRAGLKKDPSKGDCLKVLVNAKQQRKVRPEVAFAIMVHAYLTGSTSLFRTCRISTVDLRGRARTSVSWSTRKLSARRCGPASHYRRALAGQAND